MLKKYFAPFIPYIAVIAGLWLFHNAWTAIVWYHAGIAIILLLAKYRPRIKGLYTGLNLLPAILPSAVGTFGGLALYFLWPFFSVPANFLTYVSDIGLTAAAWPFFMVYYSLVNPLAEELFWRGYLGSASRWPTTNDVLFSGYHLLVLADKISLFWLVVVFIVLTFAAWYWRQVDKNRGGLLPSILSHFTADVAIILVIFLESGNRF